MRSRTWLAGLMIVVFASAGVVAAPEPMSEAKLREMFQIPADAKLSYQDEDGATLTREQFSKRIGAAASFVVIKDSGTGTTTFKIEKPGEKRWASPVTKLPAIDLTDLRGRRITDASLDGKPTLISFFFAECVPCIKEVPILNAFAEKHAEYNYFAITFDDLPTARAFVTKHKLDWPVVAEGMPFIEAAGVKGFPTYLLRSASGQVLGSESGLDAKAMQDPAQGVATLEKWVSERSGVAKAGAWEPLLDAGLSKFDVYLSYRGDQIMSVVRGTAPATLKPVGLNPPKQNVFSTVQLDGKPALRITGEYYGCLVTKNEYSNFHLRARVKWGDKKWVPRLDQPKDSGILYHSRGPFGVDYWKSWQLSQEFQVIERGLGEYWTQASSAFDIRVGPKEPSPDKSLDAPRWNPKAPWMTFTGSNNHALAGSDEENPRQWNQLELVCFQDDCVHVVNGKVVMALRDSRYKAGDKFVAMTGGKLQIQSEAAEVFYRDLEIRRIPAMPAEYARYFD
jgi:thiol-disulfide isomerase/thioredoxin